MMKKQNNQNKILLDLCFVFSLAVYLSLFTTTTLAQFDLPTIGDVKPTLSLVSNPSTPLPNSTVAITANISGIIGAGGSHYTWFLNSVRQANASGTNKNTLNVRTGDIGTTYRVSVNVATPNGENLSETLNLTVSDVDLTWTTNSKSPIFYRAKSLPTQNSIVTIAALPFVYRPGTRSQISSGTLIYNWTIDGKFDSLKSGINKQPYILRTGNSLGNSIIRLEVKTQDGTVSLTREISVPVVRPQALLYFSDPKTEMPFGIALKNVLASGANFNFAAQAYFFTALANNLDWQWFINNTEVTGNEENPWLATLNLKDKIAGQFSIQIKVTAKNPKDELESAQSITNLEIR